MTSQKYVDCAKKMQGKPSKGMKILGGLMIALCIAVLVVGLICFPMLVGVAGAAAAALSLTVTATQITAGVALGTTTAAIAGGAAGCLFANRAKGLFKAMRDVNDVKEKNDNPSPPSVPLKP